MVRYAVALTSMLMLLGCASTAKWQHPMAPNEDADTMTIALAECESYAAGMTPMPKFQGYMPIPSPTSYTTTGTLNTISGCSLRAYFTQRLNAVSKTKRVIPFCPLANLLVTVQ